MTMALPTAILHAFLLLSCSITAAASAATILPQCPADCGGVAIPYPFGIGKGCYRDGFDLTCKALAGGTPKPRLNTGNVEVVEILPVDGLLRVNQPMANNCYISPEKQRITRSSIDLAMRPYKFSDTRNKFVSIGCDTMAYLIDGTQEMSSAKFSTGCTSICSDINYVENYTCSGVGCCETRVPRGLRSYNINLDTFNNHQKCLNFSPCSFGFLADITDFNFSIANLSNLMYRDYYPVTLEWSIGNQTCKEEGGTACVAANSICYDATAGVGGYRCNCSEGFTGNPYLVGGCIDIDECKVLKTPCIGRCNNIIGNYTCTCPEGMTGDGRPDGDRCKCLPGMEDDNVSGGCKTVPKFPLVAVILGTGFTILFIIAMVSWLFWMRKKAQMAKFFLQNGGDILKKRNSESRMSATMIYSSAELSKATNNYSQPLGTGTYGTVYRGILLDQTEVAIKKSKVMGDQYRTEQFINEVVILSSIHHKNIVRLLGCCLETEVPLLVYEFVPNRNLFEHIHKEGSLSFEDRLSIATETAEALTYMHSQITTPIYHRDIKSANILLTKNLTAKVADFGASQLVPSNEKELVSFVVGTYGYLDPVFHQTRTFTDKSDVYSFGMVLIELLTGKKVSSNVDGPKENRTLATYFISCMNDDRLEEALDKHILDEKPQLKYITEIAQLALCCLELNREQRPTMEKVSEKLKDLAARMRECIKNKDEDTKPSAAKAQEDSTFDYGNTAQGFHGDSKKSITEDLHKDPKKSICEVESSIGPVLPFNITR